MYSKPLCYEECRSSYIIKTCGCRDAEMQSRHFYVYAISRSNLSSYPADLRIKVVEMFIPIRLHLHLLNSTEIWIYLTIRLRARNFYEVIVNKGEARVYYRFREIQSEYSQTYLY